MGAGSRNTRRLIAVVGDQLRHRWYLARLSALPGLELAGAVIEQKRQLPRGESAEDDAVLSRHFAARGEAEARFFGDAESFEPVDTLRVPFGGSNDPEVAEWIFAREPDAVSLFGCSIIRDQILEALPDRVVNLHLGLSPYYRGAATNFWPLVRGEPECVGATVHLATLDVDAGPILRQARPSLEPDDGAHDAGCRAIMAGVAALGDVLPAYVGERVQPVAQRSGGLVFRNRDFGPDAVRQLQRRLDAGMIPEYLDDKSRRDSRFPIVA